MVAFLVRPPGGTGGKALLAGIHVGAASKNKAVAITVGLLLGYILSSALFVVPMYTFVKPIHEENGVGDRTAYGHILTMSNCIAWTLYAIPSFWDNIYTVIVNSAGFLLQLGYVCYFLRRATEDARRRPLYLLVAVLLLSVGLSVLVVVMVVVKGTWDKNFVGIIASIITGVAYIYDMVQVVAVLKENMAGNNLDLLVEVLLNLSNASVWTFCAFLATPVDLYSGIPCSVGAIFLLAQLGAYLLCPKNNEADRRDDDDFGFELRALFESPV